MTHSVAKSLGAQGHNELGKQIQTCNFNVMMIYVNMWHWRNTGSGAVNCVRSWGGVDGARLC